MELQDGQYLVVSWITDPMGSLLDSVKNKHAQMDDLQEAKHFLRDVLKECWNKICLCKRTGQTKLLPRLHETERWCVAELAN